ncbi:hypothetical protein Cpap_1836 [Ruminiclostridium papyrosolvens DSM 2782]|uniref:Uncharacterized protein n=2 Tax=Ruminiclostridium papyrosolvens TaxID=29362 RepID=F1TDK3_9FIRM|nr:hypothetical protein Cpap_1836 [Ruminiclostridium papyrosolvens DSM 2782]
MKKMIRKISQVRMKGMNFIKVEDFEDIYKGNRNNTTSIILEMKVRFIAAKRKGVIDIQVF